MQAQEKSLPFKLVLLGDSNVGKSSIVLRFVRKQFFEYQESTIGAAFSTQTVKVDDYTVKFEIWDTAGMFPCRLSGTYDAKSVLVWREISDFF
mmetsp:Transcript_23860/g.38441  ORF Transcript_23860/g.38441 Transcript_23860/m.38441 type:complete len:93 (-) Transcript_23860:255-533(-)